jgi:hypothetical protein
MKSVVTIILLLFVAASVTYLVVGEARSKTVPTDPAVKAAIPPTPVAGESPRATAKPADEKQAPVLVAYYFHGTMRCPTCLKMEQYAKEAIEEKYPSELENGRFRWEAVNYDEPANEHFRKEFELVASTLVVVSNGPSDKRTWRKLERTWDIVGDEAAFKRYVVDEVTALLGSGS